MGRYFTQQQKQVAVDKYFECKNSSTVVATLGYPSVNSLLKWAKKDPRWSRPKRHNKVYSYETKLACVSAYLDTDKSCRYIGKKYGVHASQVCYWTKRYLKSGPDALKPVRRKDTAIKRRIDQTIPDETLAPEEVSDADLRTYCEKLKFENDVMRAKLELLSKKSPGLSEEKLTAKEKAEIIDSLRHTYKVKQLLESLELSKRTYEYQRNRKEICDRYAFIKQEILSIFEKSKARYGYRRIRIALRKEASIWLSGKTVRKLMKDLDIRPIQRRKRRYNSYKKQTTQPEPNILNRNFHSSTICEKLVSDVTEFQVAGHKSLFLATY